jgi:hypothetical protein
LPRSEQAAPVAPVLLRARAAAQRESDGSRVWVWFQHEHARPVQACSLAVPRLSAGMRERVRGRVLELGEIRQLAAWLRALPQAV